MIQDNTNFLQLRSNLDSDLLSIKGRNNKDESLIYEMKNLKELVITYFLNEYAKFSALVELSNEFIEEALASTTGLNNDNSQAFHFIINALLTLIE
ncbi:12401_t:CDS:1, partial [Cetraspora pellucida]